MTGNPWQVVPGEELVGLHQAGEIGDVALERSAVYSWRLSMRPPSGVATNSESLTDWMDTLLSLPYGEIGNTRLSHTLSLGSIEVRGTGLGDEKKRVLKAFLRTRDNRQWFLRYLESLSPSTLALYTGETGNLTARIQQHMDGASDFGNQINNHSGLTWDKLDLHFVDLGKPTDSSNKTRKLLEYITAVTTLSGYTKRPG